MIHLTLSSPPLIFKDTKNPKGGSQNVAALPPATLWGFSGNGGGDPVLLTGRLANSPHSAPPPKYSKADNPAIRNKQHEE